MRFNQAGGLLRTYIENGPSWRAPTVPHFDYYTYSRI